MSDARDADDNPQEKTMTNTIDYRADERKLDLFSRVTKFSPMVLP